MEGTKLKSEDCRGYTLHVSYNNNVLMRSSLCIAFGFSEVHTPSGWKIQKAFNMSRD